MKGWRIPRVETDEGRKSGDSAYRKAERWWYGGIVERVIIVGLDWMEAGGVGCVYRNMAIETQSGEVVLDTHSRRRRRQRRRRMMVESYKQEGTEGKRKKKRNVARGRK